MKRILNTLGVVLALGFGLTSCQEEVRQLEFTDKGPEMTIDSYTQSVYMGGDIKFDVTLSDEKFALSTLKGTLLFDGTVVNEFYLRTKEYGKYEGNAILCPLKANIPDGVAQLELVAENVGMGKTTKVLDINVTRPNFDELTLVSGGTEYKLAKTADYQYAMAGNLPADLPAVLKSPSVNSEGDVITIGWDGSALAAGVDEAIPFSQKNAGYYEVKVNLLTLEASPFGTLSVPITEAANVQVVDLIQGASLVFPGIPEIFTWDFDFDFFRLEEDNTVTFKAINGKYRLNADYAKKFIRIDMWNPETDDYARMNLDNPAASAIYAIGDGIGKPTPGASWNTTDGAWCLAQHEPNVYQITFVAGNNVSADNMNWKIFENRGWDGSFGYVNKEAGTYAVIGDDGNVHSGSENLKVGQGYTFKFDLTGGKDAVKFSVEEADVPVSGLNIKVNGVAAQKISATLYRVPVIDLKPGDVLQPEGVQVDASWYFDPDFIGTDGKFIPTAGKYGIDIYLDGKYVKFYKVKADGSHATLDEGALWMMAWGLAHPVMTNQLAFNPGSAYCMAEISPKVFQFTGIAVEETDGTTVGGRFRYDYISCKYFYQDGWGGEMVPGNLVFKGNAGNLLAAPGNIELAEGAQLEKGATYRMTIDLTTAGTEVVTFDKL